MRRLRRALGGVTCGAVLLGAGPLAQAQDVPAMAKAAHPVFEVATVKLTDPNDGSSGFHLRGRRVQVENETVTQMVVFAYGVQRRQIAGEPDWVDKEKYDVDGVPDIEGQPDFEQMKEMVRKLLSERFGLKLHRESREMTVYALRAAKGGPKLTKTASGPEALADQTGNSRMMRFTANSMGGFASYLQFVVDRPVVDQTGLTGRYDFTLRWLAEGVPVSDTDAAEPLFTAIPEQLGLKLEPTRAATEVLVIDAIERPTAD